jgi:hypothetical protein
MSGSVTSVGALLVPAKFTLSQQTRAMRASLIALTAMIAMTLENPPTIDVLRVMRSSDEWRLR